MADAKFFLEKKQEPFFECGPFIEKMGILHGIYYQTYEDDKGGEGGYVLVGNYYSEYGEVVNGRYLFSVDGFRVFKVNCEWDGDWTFEELKNYMAYLTKEGQNIIILTEEENNAYEEEIKSSEFHYY